MMQKDEMFVLSSRSRWQMRWRKDITRAKLPCKHLYMAVLSSNSCWSDSLETHFRYKPVILLSTIAGSVIFALIAWTNSFVGLLLAQVLYGTYMATEIAYFTYIYAKVERSKYQLVTGQTRAAKLVGSFLGCSLSQVLVSFGLMSFFGLTLLSFASEWDRPRSKLQKINISN